MSKQHRWSQIMDLCQSEERVEIQTLVNALNVSEATIRRDLQQMEDLQMITRFHGGAMANTGQLVEPPMIYKSETNIDAKRKVARLAASFIKDNQMVYIDAGSSTYEMLDAITAKNITVVTIGIPHIIKLGQNSIRTMTLGGTIRWSTQAITGNQAMDQLDSMFFDVAFIGVNGIHKLQGMTTTNEQEASIKSKVIKQSTQTFFLSDHSKFNKLFPAKYADLKDGIVLTDSIDDFDENILNHKIVSMK